mmetsp:Transcript_62677/g.130290  ORF Transcript_62677/g.130290 Transcript_62677/m.130290 type:complete len:366 (-) Transcript_62677:966-2063(-)
MQGDPNYDYCWYAASTELDPHQEFYSSEEAMLAHIPGIQGRAATMGAALGDTIFGTGGKFGVDATLDLNTDTIETTLCLDSEESITPEPAPLPADANTLLAEQHTSEPTCVNPFTKTAPTSRGKLTSTFLFDSIVMPFLWTLQTLSLLQHALAPRTRQVLFTVLLLAGVLTFALPTIHDALGPRFHVTYAMSTNFGMTSSALKHYLLDSGCSTSIIADTHYLINIRPMAPTHVKGLTGVKTLDLQADLHLPVRTATNKQHTICVWSVFYDPDGHYNLISSDQLNASAYDVFLTTDPKLLSLHFKDEAGYSRHIPVSKVGKLFNIPVLHQHNPDQTSFVANCGTMSLEELVHLSMAHTPYTKLVSM